MEHEDRTGLIVLDFVHNYTKWLLPIYAVLSSLITGLWTLSAILLVAISNHGSIPPANWVGIIGFGLMLLMAPAGITVGVVILENIILEQLPRVLLSPEFVVPFMITVRKAENKELELSNGQVGESTSRPMGTD